jgi:hypothetical protein
MIKNSVTAKRISELMLDISGQLDASVALSKEPVLRRIKRTGR